MKNPCSLPSALLCALFALTLTACRGGNAQTPSAHPRPAGELPAAQLASKFGGRAPRPCPAIKHPPSEAEAAVLVQCTMEGPYADEETFLTDVKIKLNGSRPFEMTYAHNDGVLTDVDTRTTIYLITGYAKTYTCGDGAWHPGTNCVMQEMIDATGSCWRTNYGEYRCQMWNSGTGWHPNLPPPSGY